MKHLTGDIIAISGMGAHQGSILLIFTTRTKGINVTSLDDVTYSYFFHEDDEEELYAGAHNIHEAEVFNIEVKARESRILTVSPSYSSLVFLNVSYVLFPPHT